MSTHIQQLIRTLKTLRSADKFVLSGGLILLCGLFLPWFSISFNSLNTLFAQETQSMIAFTGTTYIIGYLCYLFILTALNTIDKKLTILVASFAILLFVSNIIFNTSEDGLTIFSTFIFLILNVGIIFIFENTKLIKRIPKHTLNLFAGLESLILIFTASMIYHKISLNYTNANLSFGVYTGFLGAALIFYGGYLQMQTQHKQSAREIFANPPQKRRDSVNLKPDLNIDNDAANQNNAQEQKDNSQLSFADYE